MAEFGDRDEMPVNAERTEVANLVPSSIWTSSICTNTIRTGVGVGKPIFSVLRGVLLIGFAIGFGVAGSPAVGQPPARAETTLVSEYNALVPGTTTMLGVLFEMQDTWHIYADSQNDTGLPPEAEWRSDIDLGFGEFQWLPGERYIQPGEILDHVYEERVLLMVPVTVPADVPVGKTIKIDAELNWLVCDSEQCLPGGQRVSLAIPVASAASKSEHAELFEAARGSIGEPLESMQADGLSLSWDGSTLMIEAGDVTNTSTDVAEPGVLRFIPGSGSAKASDLLATGASENGRLAVAFADGLESASPAGGSNSVVGWIVWTDARHTEASGSHQTKSEWDTKKRSKSGTDASGMTRRIKDTKVWRIDMPVGGG